MIYSNYLIEPRNWFNFKTKKTHFLIIDLLKEEQKKLITAILFAEFGLIYYA